jgi:hypothetical protein
LALTAALLGAAILCALPAGAWADVRIIEAGSATLVVEARDATVQQVLEALSESRHFEFRTSQALSRVLTGTYRGPLLRVLARILEGYDNVIETDPSGIRLSVLGAAGTARPAPPVVRFLPRPATTSGPMPVSIGHAVSSNVDQDEENALTGTVGLSPAKAAAPRPAVNSMPAIPAAVVGNARGPAGGRVSTHVDLDDETSR